MNTPPPLPEQVDLTPKWKLLRILGVCLAIGGPLFGILGTVIGMTQAFAALAEAGNEDPGDLAESINVVLQTTAFGLLFLPIGVVCILIANRKLKAIALSHEF